VLRLQRLLLDCVLTVGVMLEKPVLAGGGANIKEDILGAKEAVLPLSILEQLLTIFFLIVRILEFSPLRLLARFR